jgi:adenosylhomocysteine nucleosidase
MNDASAIDTAAQSRQASPLISDRYRLPISAVPFSPDFPLPSATPSADDAHADIGIVCAVPIELSQFLSRCDRQRSYSDRGLTFRGAIYDGIRIAVVESGAGPAKAERATHDLVDVHSPTWVLSCGFGGALRPTLKVGDIVAANELADEAGQTLHIDLKMTSDPARRLHVGRLITVRQIIRTVAEKKALAETSGALAVDMETFSAAQVCRDRHRKFLAFRVISDDLSADLPPEVMSIFGDTGAVRFGAVVGSLWKRPSSITDLWRLREHAVQAADRLADFLDGVVKQLYAAEH